MKTYQSKHQFWSNALVSDILEFVKSDNEGRVLSFLIHKLQSNTFQTKIFPALYISKDTAPETWCDENGYLDFAIKDTDLPKDAICICKDANGRLMVILTSDHENIIIFDRFAKGNDRVVVSSISSSLRRLLAPLVNGAMSDVSLNFIIGNLRDEAPVTVRLRNLMHYYEEGYE